jgi:hypothetical protein
MVSSRGVKKKTITRAARNNSTERAVSIFKVGD